MSQKELARAAGIHPQYVYLLEKGTSMPTLPVARKLARALGVDVDEIFPPHAGHTLGEPCSSCECEDCAGAERLCPDCAGAAADAAYDAEWERSTERGERARGNRRGVAR